MTLTLEACVHFRNGFSGDFRWFAAILAGRQETVRFPGEPSSRPGSFPDAQSQ
jgi:hypothetical protein